MQEKKIDWGKGIAIFTLVVGLISVGIKYRHTWIHNIR